ncbi:MAG: hypothetical protein HIU83_10650 [Proteobacteria bacterium]|nr:hypothetical protein [Pseudomonadota bacterium]
MPEAETAIAVDYSELIKEVYIDPIRTVIVIDDEFPSLDGLIAKELGEEKPWAGKRDDVEKVRHILDFCRGKEKPWLVDVHDGKKVDADQDEFIAPYLHHSDLVILDYHLEGNDGTGEKAIKILRKLAANDHFNLVVVYTKGYGEPGGDIDRVVREIALGLATPDPTLELLAEEIENLKSGLGEWEIVQEDILKELQDLVSEQTYLSIPTPKGLNCRSISEIPELCTILEKYKNKPKGAKIKFEHLVKWLLGQKEKELLGQLSTTPLGTVSLSKLGEAVNWIRTDRLFVSVVSKSHQPNEIPDKLLCALNEWCPRPHRLLMAKMRSLIDERGVAAEADVLSNHYIQAGWLLELLDSSEQDTLGAISNTINRHWEAMGDALTADIGEFGKKLITYLSAQDPSEIIKLHSPIKDPVADANNITKALNCYISTKTSEGSHLTTGHVLEIMNADERLEYWVCLSPACDLVPGQKTSGWFGRLGNYLPFSVVFLSEVNEKTALAAADQNIYLFLEIDGIIRTFTFNPNGELKSNPSWEQMFALNKGSFVGEERKVNIARLTGDAENLALHSSEAKVVCQLRYEYALNLLQRLGVSLSRIGLDFRNIKREEEKRNR